MGYSAQQRRLHVEFLGDDLLVLGKFVGSFMRTFLLPLLLLLLVCFLAEFFICISCVRANRYIRADFRYSEGREDGVGGEEREEEEGGGEYDVT